MRRFALAVGMALFLTACTEPADRALKAEVENQLTAAKLPGSFAVAADDGVIRLSGTVPDAATKEQARLIAMGVGGVERVVNDLRATSAADAPPEGADIPAPPRVE